MKVITPRYYGEDLMLYFCVVLLRSKMIGALSLIISAPKHFLGMSTHPVSSFVTSM